MQANPIVPLLIRFGRVGDMVLQAPLLHLLHRRYGQPCRLLGAGDWVSPLFEGGTDVAQIWLLEGRHTPLLLSRRRREIVAALRTHAGPVYVSEDIERSLHRIRGLLTLGGIPPERCVFIRDMPPLGNEHVVDQLLRFGCETPAAFAAVHPPWTPHDIQLAPELTATSEVRAERDVWLRQRGYSDRPLVLIQPGNKRSMKWGRARPIDAKAWPVANWVALLRAIHAHLPSAIVLLCGSPNEAPMLESIRSATGLDAVRNAASELPLRRLIAVLEGAHSMVSVDTGPAHIAAAVGCPLVVLYGAETPQRWGRRSPSGSPIVELGGTSEMTNVRDIPLDAVSAAWSRLSAATRSPK